MPAEVVADDSISKTELPAEEELAKNEEGDESAVDAKASRDEA